MGNTEKHFNNFIDCKSILISASADNLSVGCPNGNAFLVWKIYE